MALEKQLADTDSIYCTKITKSNQSSIFISNLGEPELKTLFGGDYKSNDEVRLRLDKRNLAFNVVAHAIDGKVWYKRKTNDKWDLDTDWLNARLATLKNVFTDNYGVFIARLNRDELSTQRLYLKGITSLPHVNGGVDFALRDFLFSGDVIVLTKLESGDVAFEVKISDNPVVFLKEKENSEFGSHCSSSLDLLRVGDVFSEKRGDNTYTVIESLPRIYRFLVSETGKIRSVPKTVVSAWYDYYKNNAVGSVTNKDGKVRENIPIRDMPTRPLRDILNQTTIDDSYEHGYDGMLGAIARWLLDNPREEQPEEQALAQPQLIPLQDRLTVALKYFEEHRGDIAIANRQVSYDTACAETRAFYATVDGPTLVTCDYEEFRKDLPSSMVANAVFIKHNEADKRRLGDFLKAVREEPKSFSYYLQHLPEVKGVGDTTLTSFLMRVRPDVYTTCSKQTANALYVLGMRKSAVLPEVTAAVYDTYHGLQTQIRDRMREMGILTESGQPADFMTVNEFTWFVHKNSDLIEKEVVKMSKKIEKAKRAKKTGTRTLKNAVGNDDLMQRLMAALSTKPFAILAGHSGTGKSRLVRRLAYMTCNDEGLLAEAAEQNAPGNYLMVQVKPNWHDSSDLLGYYSELKGQYKTTAFVDFICKAYAYPDTPFFVCLDEMNLAPVEHYFAEYLSAIESVKEKDNVYSCDPLIADKKIDFRQLLLGDGYIESQEIYEKQGLIIPKNLFVVGTVNVDETTHQFSRKVLDRAMTLLMNDVDFSSMTATPTDPSEEGLLDKDGIDFFLNRKLKEPLQGDEPVRLNKLNEALKNTAFMVAYRFANEMALYRKAIAKLSDNADALDHVVLMKLLPRIHGEANSVRTLFGKLKPLFEGGALSVAEMDMIEARPDSYLSFWP